MNLGVGEGRHHSAHTDNEWKGDVAVQYKMKMCVQMKKERREISQVCHLSLEMLKNCSSAVLEMSTLFHTLFRLKAIAPSERRDSK